MTPQAAVRGWEGAIIGLARRSTNPPSSDPVGDRRAARHQEHVLGRFMARWAATQLLGASGPVRIDVGASGAPVLRQGGPDGSGVWISVTHSSRYVAAVASRQRCGIDVCDLEDAARVQRIGRRVFSEHELQRLEILTGGWAAATAWAMKEACVKASHGSMFGQDPHRFDILPLTPAGRAASRRAASWRLPEGVLAVVLTTASDAYCDGGEANGEAARASRRDVTAHRAMRAGRTGQVDANDHR
jgi:phosphopantetheinyl transferase